jgi:hypothetical protein
MIAQVSRFARTPAFGFAIRPVSSARARLGCSRVTANRPHAAGAFTSDLRRGRSAGRAAPLPQPDSPRIALNLALNRVRKGNPLGSRPCGDPIVPRHEPLEPAQRPIPRLSSPAALIPAAAERQALSKPTGRVFSSTCFRPLRSIVVLKAKTPLARRGRHHEPLLQPTMSGPFCREHLPEPRLPPERR